MIEAATVEDRLRRTYTTVAARTLLAPRALPDVLDEAHGHPRRPHRTRALLAGAAVIVCAFVAAGFVFTGSARHPHRVVEVFPTTTQARGLPPIKGVTRVTLPGSFTALVPAVGPVAITPDGRTAYVGTSAFGVVTPIDLRTGQARAPINVGRYPVNAIAITPDGRTVYVVEGGIADTVVPIDVATRTAGPPIHVAGTRGLGSSIAITPDGRKAYVSSLSEDEIHADSPGTDTEAVPSFVVPIDLTTSTSQRPIALEALATGGHVVETEAPVCGVRCAFNETIGGIAITPDGRTVYVSDTTTRISAVFPIDVRTGEVGPPIADGGAAGPIVIAPDGKTAYVAGVGTITPIDVVSDTSVPALHVGPGVPFSTMAITPDGRTLAAVRYRWLDVLDLRTGKVPTSVHDPSGGTDIAIAPVDHSASTR